MEIAKTVEIELGGCDSIGLVEPRVFGDVGHRGVVSIGRPVGRKWVRSLAVPLFVATKRELGPH
jgi:hypothetical protein